jgi:hypothetical protein
MNLDLNFIGFIFVQEDCMHNIIYIPGSNLPKV